MVIETQAAVLLDHSRCVGLVRDFTDGLYQEMYFLGKDVIHRDGNLLLKRGFTKSPSAGLQGTSCYGLDWQEGRIELHGACAGWYPKQGGQGFLFVRPHRKCFSWLGGPAPVPGEWPRESLGRLDPHRFHECCLPFLDWWLFHERWISRTYGSAYRQGCHHDYSRLPKSKPWLAPENAVGWLEKFRDNPSTTPRAKRLNAPDR